MNFPILENVDVPISQKQFQRIDLDSLDYDLGTHKQILEYHVNQCDEIRRAYIIKGLHQPSLKTFKKSGKYNRSFQASWFGNNSTWLEYSPMTDAAYCLPCFVFHNSNGVVGQNIFIVGGFRNWRRLGAKIVIFKVAEIIEKAPKNATYTSPRIQKETIHVFSAKVKKAIREEIGDAKFCLMVDKARDESMKEQMAVIYKIFKCKDMMEQATCELFLIKIVNASCKRNEQLKVANANEIVRLIDLEELETRSGFNQIGTLQRPVETHWSSHFRSVSSLLRMFASTVEVLQNIIGDAIGGEHRAKAKSAYDSFNFI
ncbi:uncharacterized protein LOC112030089 [Quercus suber]|uniref:uncharacterized protein LOC112030089 n=1 Tax=Quercus suber TaxID=58331 RepID=UPI0032DF772F